MNAFGFPAHLPVPSLYRVLRTFELDATGVSFDIRAASVPADVLAEVQHLFPSATQAQIAAAAIIKQVDVLNTGYDNSTPSVSQSLLIEYIEHDDGGTPPAPTPASARNIIPPGSSASYPSAMAREMTTFLARTTAATIHKQVASVIVWFDVPGLGS